MFRRRDAGRFEVQHIAGAGLVGQGNEEFHLDIQFAGNLTDRVEQLRFRDFLTADRGHALALLHEGQGRRGADHAGDRDDVVDVVAVEPVGGGDDGIV